MICFNCKRQIPDNSQVCPNCGVPIIPQVQVTKEIRFRRWQRWVLYGVIAVVFVAMTAYAVKVYNDNTKLLNAVTTAQANLKQTQATLDTTQQNLTAREGELTANQTRMSELEQSLTASQQQLTQKTDEFKRTIDQQTLLIQNFEQFKVNLGAENANTYAALIELGTGVPNNTLIRIPVADFNLGNGADTDNDGLSDIAEVALGTDPNKADTDGDTYNDKNELLAGFSAIATSSTAKLPLDPKVSQMYAGKILLQTESKGEAWYVNPKDGKRYFLGRPAEALQALQKLGLPK